jgi:cell division protein FtsN/thiol-disulfide isomerase/thioredoxin
MSIKKIIGLAAMMLLISVVGFAQGNQIDFIKGGVSAAKTRAVSEGKLYFAFFYTDWCLPCKWMEDNTFKDKEIIQFINQNYLAVKINIDDFDGHAHRQQYNVEFLPTIIIFSQGGDILGKYEESLSSTRFMEAIRKHRFDMANTSVKLPALNKSDTKPPAATPPKTEQAQPVKTEETVKKAPETLIAQTVREPEVKEEKAPERPKVTQKQVEDIKPEPAKSEPAKPEKVVEPAPEPKKEQPAKPIEAAPETKKEQAAKPAAPPSTTSSAADPSKYFAVQVGTFSRFENADAKRNEFKEVFGEGVHIKIDRDGKETIYRVMIGRYQTAEAARSLVSLLKEQGIDGFIREVSKD